MTSINQQFMISIVIILIGYLTKRTGLITRKEGEVLNKVIMNVTLPALILKVFSKMYVNQQLLILALISVVIGFIMYLITRKLFANEVRENKGVLIISNIGFNIGLFAYPFVESIWGEKGLQHIAIFDMGNAFLIFGLSYIVATMHSPQASEVNTKYIVKKMLTFLPLLSYVLALLISFSHTQVPHFVYQLVSDISMANGILVLLVIGIYLDFSIERNQLKSILKLIFVKYSIGIAAGLAFYFFLPFDLMFRSTVLLGFILPTAMAVLPYTVENKLNDKIAGGVVNLTNIISFVLMWIVFSVVH